MLVPVVVHWEVPPLITVKLPDASTFNLVLSYFNDIVLDVFNNGFEKVKLFCFVVNKVVDVAFKLLIDNVELVDNEFKLLKMVVDVAFQLSMFNLLKVDKLFTFVFVAKVEPLTVNDDIKVALVAIKLFVLISYNPELFIYL